MTRIIRSRVKMFFQGMPLILRRIGFGMRIQFHDDDLKAI